MNDLTLSIKELKTKVEKLIEIHKQVKEGKQKLATENNNLKKLTEVQTSIIEQLEKKIKELSQNNSKEQKEKVTITKSKINELVQEIDNCIALLK